ncbi:UNVERIFIED_CONTAM: hypothetical protein HDU68_008500 [Siphonaria sp. JEL0065]|nr:hypothetical protein HDU68_008500 [Siphonaria sp. JEL0065]
MREGLVSLYPDGVWRTLHSHRAPVDCDWRRFYVDSMKVMGAGNRSNLVRILGMAHQLLEVYQESEGFQERIEDEMNLKEIVVIEGFELSEDEHDEDEDEIIEEDNPEDDNTDRNHEAAAKDLKEKGNIKYGVLGPFNRLIDNNLLKSRNLKQVQELYRLALQNGQWEIVAILLDGFEFEGNLIFLIAKAVASDQLDIALNALEVTLSELEDLGQSFVFRNRAPKKSFRETGTLDTIINQMKKSIANRSISNWDTRRVSVPSMFRMGINKLSTSTPEEPAQLFPLLHRGYVEGARVLLSHGAKLPTCTDLTSKTPLLHAATQKKWRPSMNFLVREVGVAIDALDSNKNTALHLCAGTESDEFSLKYHYFRYIISIFRLKFKAEVKELGKRNKKS